MEITKGRKSNQQSQRNFYLNVDFWMVFGVSAAERIQRNIKNRKPKLSQNFPEETETLHFDFVSAKFYSSDRATRPEFIGKGFLFYSNFEVAPSIVTGKLFIFNTYKVTATGGG